MSGPDDTPSGVAATETEHLRHHRKRAVIGGAKAGAEVQLSDGDVIIVGTS